MAGVGKQTQFSRTESAAFKHYTTLAQEEAEEVLGIQQLSKSALRYFTALIPLESILKVTGHSAYLISNAHFPQSLDGRFLDCR